MTAPIGNSITPPPPPPGPPVAGQSASGKAVAALVLGIIGLVSCCFPAGIAAIIVGKMELNAIDQGRSLETNRNFAKIGYILGIVGVGLTCLGVLISIILNVMGFALFGSMPKQNTF